MNMQRPGPEPRGVSFKLGAGGGKILGRWGIVVGGFEADGRRSELTSGCSGDICRRACLAARNIDRDSRAKPFLGVAR